MRERRRRILRRGHAMHERDRPERRFTGITKVGKPGSAFTNWQGVLRRQLHKQIVRMLPVDERLAFVSFAGLEKQRRSARRKSKRFKTEHAAQLQSSLAELVIGH